MQPAFSLLYGLNFADLYARDGLLRVDAAFCDALKEDSPSLYAQFLAARAHPPDGKEESTLLMALAPYVEDFLARLFGIEKEMDALIACHHALAPLYVCKRLFVQRKAAKHYTATQALQMNAQDLESTLSSWMRELVTELAFATHVMRWLQAPEMHADRIETALHYAAWALYTPAGQEKHKQGVLFKQPRKIDYQHLVPAEEEEIHGVRRLKLPDAHLRHREGFALTDAGASLTQALDQTHYCIFCHHQGRDSCSKGIKEKDAHFKKSVLDVALEGCPLEEKISEMNELKSSAHPLGALAVAMIDNPMIAGTGHRICNDCMKSCIYQKQEPVNIPLAETRIVADVLELPWGVEIYSLLSRWNPLHFKRPLPLPATEKKILVVGMGPAGYTLAHHLMNDGYSVVGIDGLKIEPLPQPLLTQPVYDVHAVYESLDERVLGGFGGVAEYGITVRWNKNYLLLLRLLLERRLQFLMMGGVRFGGTITRESAFASGFDHIALCMGAGKPTLLDIPDAMARGVRAASDFLMALQLTGAAKKESLANLQLRLPVVVIGGGLTAIDTATEALAYYPVQVEKFLSRHERLVMQHGEDTVSRNWSPEEKIIAEEFIAHAREIRAERAKATLENRLPGILSLLKTWGGATVAYRKSLADAPSYRLNHEEVEKAMEEGIFFIEHFTPSAMELDSFNHVKTVRSSDRVLPARAVLVAAGTSPNTVLAREDAEHFMLEGKYFQAVDEQGAPVTPERSAKPSRAQIMLSVDEQGRGVSFFGDLHPSFAGNVVKAMASAKRGYPVISTLLADKKPACAQSTSSFLQEIKASLSAHIHAVNRLTPTIVEVVIKAPAAARAFQPGQFYRLQNFEMLTIGPVMEGVALTGASVDKEKGLLSTIVLEMGGSSNKCADLKPGEPVVLMGPTGTPTEIPEAKTVMLAGGGLGNAVLFSIGKAMREQGCKILYFAGYKKLADRYKVEEIEAAADVVIWCSDEAPGFIPSRAQDRAFTGNIVQAMLAYAESQSTVDSGQSLAETNDYRLATNDIRLKDVEHIIAIGSDRMMAAVAHARHHALKPYLNPRHVAVGSINSPMQCMMKEICAQCVQKHVDPETGKESFVFSCFNQDQNLDKVCFEHLHARLTQNSVSEKQTALWTGDSSRSKNMGVN